MSGSGQDEIRMSVLFITHIPASFRITVREALDDFCEQLSQRHGDYFVTDEENRSVVFVGPRSVFQEITDRAEKTV